MSEKLSIVIPAYNEEKTIAKCINELQATLREKHEIPYEIIVANDPAIILADEPTGNLDLNTGKAIISLLKEMNRERGVTIISATHDLKMLDISDRILWIRDGAVDKIERRADVKIDTGEIH